MLLILQVKNAKTGWCFAPTKQVALYHEVIPAMLKANQVPKPPPKPKKGANIETSAATQAFTPLASQVAATAGVLVVEDNSGSCQQAAVSTKSGPCFILKRKDKENLKDFRLTMKRGFDLAWQPAGRCRQPAAHRRQPAGGLPVTAGSLPASFAAP